MATVVARADQSAIWWVFLLEGIAALIFGALLLTNPAATLVALAVFLGFYLLFVGVLELVRVFVDRSQPWHWSLIISILGIVAGIIVLNHPGLAALALPMGAARPLLGGTREQFCGRCEQASSHSFGYPGGVP